jgi:hypothetical protein
MPPVHCAADNCNRQLKRGDKIKGASGDFICYKCYGRERRQVLKDREQEEKVAAAGSAPDYQVHFTMKKVV